MTTAQHVTKHSKPSALAVILAITSFSVDASPSASVSVNASGGFPFNACQDQANTTSSASAACGFADATFQAGALAFAGAGAVRLSAATVLSGAAAARANYTEVLTLELDPSLAGQTGTLFGQFVVAGSLGATASGSNLVPNFGESGLSFQGGIGSASVSTSGNYSFGVAQGQAESAFASLLPVEWVFRIGNDGKVSTAIFLAATVSAGSVARDYRETSTSPIIGGYASASASFSDTMYWSGIQSLRIGDQPVTAYVITSESGFDYATGYVPTLVPEPRSYALMLAGLGFIGAIVRLRRAEQE